MTQKRKDTFLDIEEMKKMKDLMNERFHKIEEQLITFMNNRKYEESMYEFLNKSIDFIIHERKKIDNEKTQIDDLLNIIVKRLNIIIDMEDLDEIKKNVKELYDMLL